MSTAEGQAGQVTGQYLLRSLGRAEVRLDGQLVVWPARSAEELLWYLHTFPEGRYRHDILSQLWGLEDTPAAGNRFRVALHRLRAALKWPAAVSEQGGRYALHPDLLAASDLQALYRALAAARLSRSPREREEWLRQALACARGDYLPQVASEWAEQARAQHRAAVVEAYLELSQLHCAAHECSLAAQALVDAAQRDPLIGEDHHQRLMACLSMTRDRYAATEHYRRYRCFLVKEVGDTPMPATEALAERIKAGEKVCLPQPFVPPGKG